MKKVYLSGLSSHLDEIFAFDDTCMYVVPQNLDFALTSTRMVMLVLAGIGTVYTLAVMLLLVFYRTHEHIQLISLPWCLVSCAGGLLCYGQVLSLYPVPDDLICAVRPWIADVAFVLLLGPMLAKLYRMDWIHTTSHKSKRSNSSKKNQRKPFNENAPRPTRFVLMPLLGFVVFLVIYSSVDRPRMQEDFTSDGLRFERCVTDHNTFVYVDHGLKGLLLLWGCFMAQRVSNIRGRGEQLTEGGKLVVCIYLTGFYGVCLVLLASTTRAHPTLNFMCEATILVVNTSVLISLVYAWPVLLVLRQKFVEQESSSNNSNTASLRIVDAGHSHASGRVSSKHSRANMSFAMAGARETTSVRPST